MVIVAILKRRGCLVLLAAVAALTIRQPAAYADDPALKVGAGARSCAQFKRDYAAAPELMEGLYFSWAQGYLTGFSMGSTSGNPWVHLRAHDDKWQQEFLREYCQKKPLSPFSEATVALMLELSKASMEGTQ